MQKMKIRGLTRNNVASHLQKYRLSLQRNCRFPKEIPNQRPFTETNPSASSNPSYLHDQNNVVHGFLGSHVMNSAPPELSNGYITANNNTFMMNNPQPLQQHPFVDHSVYPPPHHLPDSKSMVREFANPMLGGDYPELIDTMFEYGSDIFQDVLPLQYLR
ncbi:PREDICTED: putative two-component response regulator ARR19 [Tarenaya hassleriana]|uniref:putative two-component response regulator ARR19 n=1 Tax=Tarenaya hassleriana TaxID=28532 RepID=UPI00053C310B|nr:PREDICTED: putative two-component response regulator ARR19 [Tarenaya hassleriana]